MTPERKAEVLNEIRKKKAAAVREEIIYDIDTLPESTRITYHPFTRDGTIYIVAVAYTIDGHTRLFIYPF